MSRVIGGFIHTKNVCSLSRVAYWPGEAQCHCTDWIQRRHQIKDLIVLEKQKPWKSWEEVGSAAIRDYVTEDYRWPLWVSMAGSVQVKFLWCLSCCSQLPNTRDFIKIGTQMNENLHMKLHTWLQSRVWQWSTGHPEFILWLTRAKINQIQHLNQSPAIWKEMSYWSMGAINLPGLDSKLRPLGAVNSGDYWGIWSTPWMRRVKSIQKYVGRWDSHRSWHWFGAACWTPSPDWSQVIEKYLKFSTKVLQSTVLSEHLAGHKRITKHIKTVLKWCGQRSVRELKLSGLLTSRVLILPINFHSSNTQDLKKFWSLFCQSEKLVFTYNIFSQQSSITVMENSSPTNTILAFERVVQRMCY